MRGGESFRRCFRGALPGDSAPGATLAPLVNGELLCSTQRRRWPIRGGGREGRGAGRPRARVGAGELGGAGREGVGQGGGGGAMLLHRSPRPGRERLRDSCAFAPLFRGRSCRSQISFRPPTSCSTRF